MTSFRAKGRRVANGMPSEGFSILEMLIASAILMVGIISVVQLVPTSLQTNANNRLDTMATVIAQRELDQILSQPLTVDTFVDKDNNVVSLGGAGSPGAPLIMDGQTTKIDFTVDPVAGFSIPNYVDPNDPTGATFELRWAVIPETSGGLVISRRIVIGCRRTNSTQLQFPVSLDTWVQKF